MREYVPIFFDWVEVTGELNAQEKGRLIDAIVLYAQGGDWQEQIKGNERYLFPAFRKQIDRANEISEVRKATGSVGGQAKASKEKQTEANDSKAKQNVANDSKIPKKEKEKEKEEEKEENKENKKRDIAHEKAKAQLELFNQFWAAYPHKAAKQDAVKAFAKLNATPELLEIMLKAIEKQMASHQWSDPQYIPHPATWLNGRRWEDEVVKGTGKNIAQTNYTQREYEEPKQGQLPAWLVEEIEAEDREKKAYFAAHGLEDTAENRKRLTRIKGEWVYT